MNRPTRARGAATPVRFLEVDQFQSGDLAEKVLRLLSNPLTVAEVAGVMVRHALCQGVCGRLDAVFRQKLADIADPAGELSRPLGIPGIIAEQLGIVLQHQPAAGNIDHNGIRLLAQGLECFDVRSGEARCGYPVAGVVMNRAAADLVGRTIHRAFVSPQHAMRRSICRAQNRFAHAAGKQADPSPWLATSRRAVPGQWFERLRFLLEHFRESQSRAIAPRESRSPEELKKTQRTGQAKPTPKPRVPPPIR